MTESAAYGLRVEGVDAGDALSVVGASEWPVVHVEQRLGSSLEAQSWVEDERASIWLPGGRILIERRTATITIVAEERVDIDRIVHPVLSTAAAVFGCWAGREAFHAGAFVSDGRAFALVGDHGAGKSTLLGALAMRGIGVLSDDVLVIDGSTCFAGPRTIDLRPQSTAHLGLGEPDVRDATRRRLRLPPADAHAELGGWFLLQWGDELTAEPVGLRERLTVLSEARSWTANDPSALLELAARPVWRVRRPCRLDLLDSTADVLAQLAADLSSPA